MLPYAFRNNSAKAQLLSSLQQLLYRGNGSYGSLLKGSFPAVRAQTCPSANGPEATFRDQLGKDSFCDGFRMPAVY
jgi:hypothetical protein